MEQINIEGVIVTPLKRIYHPQGDVFHGMKKSDHGFVEFGEAYFSTILTDQIKPWKKHTRMTLNLIVPIGKIRFVIFDDRPESTTKKQFFEEIISEENYCRLTVPPGVWMGFQGLETGLNLLLNIADLEHDPAEIVRCELDDIPYSW